MKDNRPEYTVSVGIEGEMIINAKSFKDAEEKVGKELEEINSLRPLILKVSGDMDCLQDNIDFPEE